MKTKLTRLLVVCAVATLPLMMDAQERRSRNRSTGTSTDGDRQVTDCRDIRVSFDRRPAITEETSITIAPSQISTLQARASNSGIYVNDWDRNEYSVKTCKAVPDDDPGDTLRQITTTN